MTAQDLLQEISTFCRQAGLAESTFGRRAVNDGKLAARLRNGGRVTTDTVDRIRAFMDSNRPNAAPAAVARPANSVVVPRYSPPLSPEPCGDSDPQRNFRFFDNRQKYLLLQSRTLARWQ